MSSVFGGFVDSQDYFDCSLSIFSVYERFHTFGELLLLFIRLIRTIINQN